MSLSEDSKEDILALALSNAATDTNAVNESSTGLLDFLNMDPVVNNNILPVHPMGATLSPVQRLPPAPPMPHEDNLMDMLGLTDDKLDTISNNELDSLLEEASKIEVPKEVEMVFNSPSIVDSSREFKFPQRDIEWPPASSPLVSTVGMLKPLSNASRPITVRHPVAGNIPKSVVTAITTAANTTANSNTCNKAFTVAPSKANTVAPSKADTVASKFSVTEAFKVLGTTGKPLANLKGQQLINLLNTSIVNTTIVSSPSLNLPMLSLASTTARTAPTTVTTVDRRYLDIITNICFI